MRQKNLSPEEAMKQIQKIFKKRGTKALEMAKREILKEKIECKAVKEALTYFMNEYWLDYSRPALLSMACEAVGGDPELTTFIAVPMTLLSGAVDIHDDIIDQSTEKRGKPTVFGKFGSDIALLVGDALLFKGFTFLCEANEKFPSEKMTTIVNIIKNAFYELGDAEALELELRKRLDVTPEESLTVARKKAANVEAYTRIGAILGGGTEAEIDALSKYGTALGMLLVMQDEYIDMLDPEEFLHRLRYECLPLPMVYALQNPKTRKKVERILRNGITEQGADKIVKIFYETQEAKYFKKAVQSLVEEAHAQLRKVKYNTYLRLLILALESRFKLS